MLRITIPETEFWDERTETYVTTKATNVQLEHSLVSLSKWESKWHKPFLSRDQKTEEETLDYIRCMTVTPNIDPIVYSALTPEISAQINAYIDNKMTATWFGKKENEKFSKEVITAEIIYYWMIELHVPFECEKWHLNRLLTLIRVCNEKNQPGKKMTAKERSALNKARKGKHKSRG